MLLPFIGFIPMILIGICQFSKPLLTDQRVAAFLQGEFPMQTAVLLVVNVAVIAWSWRRWSDLANLFAELGVAPGQGWTRFIQQLSMINLRNREEKYGTSTSMFFRKWGEFWGIADEQIERVNRITDFSTMSARMDRWCCGESPWGQRGMIRLGMFYPWMICGIYLGTNSFLRQTPIDVELFIFYSVLVGPLTAPFGMCALNTGTLGRRPLLSQELMWPVSRQEFNSSLTWSAWYAIRPVLWIAMVYALCIPLVLPWAPKNWNLSTPLLLSYVAFCAASTTFIWLGMLFAMTIQRSWLRTFPIVLFFAFLMFSLQLGSTAIMVGDRLFPTYIVIPAFFLSFLLVTPILGWFTFRRLPNVEWGR